MSNTKSSAPSLFTQLDDIVERLRAENGCPWDQKQTPVSIKKYLIEEATELAEALDQGNPVHICEEIGDLYFILAIICAMYRETNTFSSRDSLQAIIEKMIRRHPHVFAGTTIGDEHELRQQWEAIKKQEGKD